MIKKSNHQFTERRTYILILLFINIYDFDFTLRLNHKYFFEIVNNNFRKT